MFNKFDVVKCNKDISLNIKKNTKGVILMIYKKDKFYYEVEFVNEFDETIGIISVNENDLFLV